MNFRASFRRAATSVRNFSKASADFQPASIWATYNRYLTEKPVLTKSITSGVISFVGDVACQKFFPHDKDDKKIDWIRTIKFTILGTALVGPMLHHWYGFLVSKIPGTSALSTLYRLACDQLVFAPFIILPAIFSASQVLNGTPEQIPDKLKADWGSTVVANFALWVPAQFINFKFIAPVYQVLFANIVGLFWNVYLSAATNKTVEAPVTVAVEVTETLVVSDKVSSMKDDDLIEDVQDRSVYEAQVEAEAAAARLIEEAVAQNAQVPEAAVQDVEFSENTTHSSSLSEVTEAVEQTVVHKQEE